MGSEKKPVTNQNSPPPAPEERDVAGKFSLYYLIVAPRLPLFFDFFYWLEKSAICRSADFVFGIWWPFISILYTQIEKGKKKEKEALFLLLSLVGLFLGNV